VRGFPYHGERAVAADCGARAERCAAIDKFRRQAIGSWRWHNAERPRSLFAQILGKFYFFNLRENLRHILFDYEEKRSCITNGAFKGAC
jgi:hypothetical protein